MRSRELSCNAETGSGGLPKAGFVGRESCFAFPPEPFTQARYQNTGDVAQRFSKPLSDRRCQADNSDEGDNLSRLIGFVSTSSQIAIGLHSKRGLFGIISRIFVIACNLRLLFLVQYRDDRCVRLSILQQRPHRVAG
jgi:hypothetical protein